jgi:large subunit ribosomal protein L24
MAIAHVRQGDTVVVVAGKERGKKGKVLRVIPEKGRVVVERINMIKKHQRPTQKIRQGGIIEREGAIHLSNVMLVDPGSGKPTRVGMSAIKQKSGVDSRADARRAGMAGPKKRTGGKAAEHVSRRGGRVPARRRKGAPRFELQDSRPAWRGRTVPRILSASRPQ